jgi:hypothetical protein
MQHLNEAIKLDKSFSAAAFAGRAWLLLKKTEKDKDYKQNAIK